MNSTAPTVTVDGETVSFEGPPPATLGDLLPLLREALAPQGRLLGACYWDGTEVLADTSVWPRSLTGRVEIETIGLDACQQALGEQTAAAREQMEAEADALATELLLRPLDGELLRRVAALTETVPPLLQALQQSRSLGPETPAGEAAATALQAIEQSLLAAVEAAEAGDVAVVAESLGEGLSLALETSRKGFAA